MKLWQWFQIRDFDRWKTHHFRNRRYVDFKMATKHLKTFCENRLNKTPLDFSNEPKNTAWQTVIIVSPDNVLMLFQSRRRGSRDEGGAWETRKRVKRGQQREINNEIKEVGSRGKDE